MSETETQATEEEFQAAKQEVVDRLVRFLELGDRLEKSPLQVQAEFMLAFQEAIERVTPP